MTSDLDDIIKHFPPEALPIVIRLANHIGKEAARQLRSHEHKKNSAPLEFTRNNHLHLQDLAHAMLDSDKSDKTIIDALSEFMPLHDATALLRRTRTSWEKERRRQRDKYIWRRYRMGHSNEAIAQGAGCKASTVAAVIRERKAPPIETRLLQEINRLRLAAGLRPAATAKRAIKGD